MAAAVTEDTTIRLEADGSRTAYVELNRVGSTGKSVERMCAPASRKACARVKLLSLASCVPKQESQSCSFIGTSFQ